MPDDPAGLPPLIAAIKAGELNTVRELLDSGTDPNSGTWYREGDAPPALIPALYYACVADAPAIVTLLLERGARTQDGESIYHAAQLNRTQCLALLLAHGADLSECQSPWGNTPLYFLVGHHDEEEGRAAWLQGLVWLLEHGADPNVPSTSRKETPLHGVAGAWPPKLATARALLAHGADPNLARADGRTAYALAMRRGNAPMAGFLCTRGAVTSLSPVDEFLAACLGADEPAARALLAAQPGLLAALTPDDRFALTAAVLLENEAAIRLMLRLGFDLAFQADDGSPLHWAAWRAQTAMVRLLVELGAPVNQPDTRFGGSTLCWAAHGSGCHPGRDGEYAAVVDLLIAADATRAAACNRWGETPESMASPAIAQHLRQRFPPGG